MVLLQRLTVVAAAMVAATEEDMAIHREVEGSPPGGRLHCDCPVSSTRLGPGSVLQIILQETNDISVNDDEHFLIYCFCFFLQQPFRIVAWDTGKIDVSSSALDDNTRQRVSICGT